VERKVFRIEQMVGRVNRARTDSASDRDAPANEPHRPAEAESMAERELAVFREVIAHQRRELSIVLTEGKDHRIARAAGELNAAVEGMETATQKILASAEAVDDCARTFASTLTDDYHHGLAQDVQDHVVRIYEACNFQDLAGQRIGKVIATLVMIEQRVAAMLECCNATGRASWSAAAVESPSNADFTSGPRLDGDAGHANQDDIDAIFA